MYTIISGYNLQIYCQLQAISAVLEANNSNILAMKKNTNVKKLYVHTTSISMYLSM